MRGEFGTTGQQPEPLIAEVAGQKLLVRVPGTGAWHKPKMADMGSLSFDKPGVYHLVLRAPDPAT